METEYEENLNKQSCILMESFHKRFIGDILLILSIFITILTLHNMPWVNAILNHSMEYSMAHNIFFTLTCLFIMTAVLGILVYRQNECKRIIKEQITHLEETNSLLTYNKEKYKVLLESIPDAVAVLDYSWRYVLANDAMCHKFLRLPRKAFIGKSIYEIFPDIESYNFFDTYKWVMENRKSEMVVDKLHFKDGRNNWYQIHVYPVSEGILVIRHDITEERIKEIALREAKEVYYNLFNNNLNTMILVDRLTLDIVDANAAACNFYGYTLEEIKNKKITDINTSPIEEVKEKAEETHLQSCNHFYFQHRLSTGEIRDVEVYSTPIVINNRSLLYSIIHDVTDKNQAEKRFNEAMEIDRLKTEFFSNISHELRTPLNVILGSLQLLELYHRAENPPSISSKTNKSIRTMKQNCYRLLRLINNLIDITRIDSGFMQLSLGNYDIISIIEDITLSVFDYARNKGLNLIFDTNVEERIMAFDLDKIERILLNLLSNAIKFTPRDGSIFVNLVDKGDTLNILVEDTGIGIATEKQSMLFKRFAQVESSLTRNHEGSGIGLSLTKAFVEIQGGTISLESTPGQGSKFVITLPIGMVEEDNQLNLGEQKMNCRIERTVIELSDIYSIGA